MSNTEQTFSRDPNRWQHLVEQAQIAWEAGNFDRANDLFEEFQNNCMGWLESIARHKLPFDEDDMITEEILAEVYLQFWEIIASGETIKNAKGLIGTILRRRINDWYRQQNTKKRQAPKISGDQQAQMLASEQANLAEIVEKRETIINTILNALSQQEQDVLVARHYYEFSVAETASRLDLTKDQVKKLTQKAIRKARLQYKGDY